MTRAFWSNPTSVLLSLFTLLAMSPVASPGAENEEASDAPGGLVIAVGIGDDETLLKNASRHGRYLHVVDRNPGRIDALRRALDEAGVYGTDVAAAVWDGERLPYVDNLAACVLVRDAGGAPEAEFLRVTAPGGKVIAGQGERRNVIVKLRPENLDAWTHYLHDPSNNAVSTDRRVGPPERLQWVGSPRWSRHHDRMASMSALVTTGERIFYIFDEGPTESILLPPDWKLVARDAFNGVVLWKRDIDRWHPHLWPLKSGPAILPRRLVAEPGRVYATLGLAAPVSVLDAGTGETLRVYEDTEGTEEILLSDGVLYLVIAEADTSTGAFSIAEVARRRGEWAAGREEQRRVVALDAATGRRLWSRESPVMPVTLAVKGARAFYHDGARIVAVDARTGDPLWRSEPAPRAEAIPSWYAPTLVAWNDVVLFSGGRGIFSEDEEDTMAAYSAATGERLWTAPHPRSGYQSPEDLLVADGLVWTTDSIGPSSSGSTVGRDPLTGEVERSFLPEVDTYWFHHRCHRSRATNDYFMTSRTGIEFIDLETGDWRIHHWVRGGCLYGIMPANGLIYAPMHDCACYAEAKQYGLSVLAPRDENYSPPAPGAADPGRLRKGPAFHAVEAPEVGKGDWPTYRADNVRSGRASGPPPKALTPLWMARAGGDLTAPVLASGRLFIASKERHRLTAIDAATGETAWARTVGGIIDSPPTIWRGRVIFGCADGGVYCLCASDGREVWRFRGAPDDRRTMAFEQMESLWPVHGSVLVHEGSVYCVAGRSMFLDGGMRFLKLDAETGAPQAEVALDQDDPLTTGSLQDRVMVLNMPVALPDVFSTDGERLYMRSQVLDFDGGRPALGPHSGEPRVQASVQGGETTHLFAPTGFLDDQWFHRSYWLYGETFASGWNGYYESGKIVPGGRIMVFDDDKVYGFGRKPNYYGWTTPLEYHLYRADKIAPIFNDAPPGDSCVRVAKSASLDPANKPLAAEAWIRPDCEDAVIASRGGESHGWSLYLEDGRPGFAIRVDNVPSAVRSPKPVSSEWTHVAGVLGADQTLTIYVNGEPTSSTRALGFITKDPAQPMEVALDGGGGTVAPNAFDYGFKGDLDELRVYHGPMTPADVRRHAGADPSALEAEVAELVLHYTFDEGDAVDASGNSNHGAVVGALPVPGRFAGALRFAGMRNTPAFFVEHDWTKDLPLIVRAMVLAGDRLFVAGPPDVVDELDAYAALGEASTQEALARQADALRGRAGGLLHVVSTDSGETLRRVDLDSPPVFDGMIVAGERLYVATMEGRVLCFGAP